MEIFRKIVKWLLVFLLIPIIYISLSLVLTFIPVHKKTTIHPNNQSIYLSTNGVHLNILFHRNQLENNILNGLKLTQDDQYLAFGWGDRDFYLNTPTWSDLTFKNAFNALFLKSPTLMHVTRYQNIQNNWVEIPVNQQQLTSLTNYIHQAFYHNPTNNKVLFVSKGYSTNDDFYEANGYYSFLKTSNSWVNRGFKESNIKACLWTPFDFGLIRLHR